MEEVWKDIEGYENRYQISNLGNVKSLQYRGHKGVEKNLVPKVNNSGRLWVELIKNGKTKQFLIHRLVGMAFIPNPDNLPQINHMDENPKNNQVDNLEWCTGDYNIKYFQERHPEFAKQRRSTGRYNRKLDKPVNQIDDCGNVVKRWNNARAIVNEIGYNQWSITQCCDGKRKSAYGFRWQYAI